MADIKINNLNPAGSELFTDSESFLNELSNDEMNIQGGAMAKSSASIFKCGKVDNSTISLAYCGTNVINLGNQAALR